MKKLFIDKGLPRSAHSTAVHNLIQSLRNEHTNTGGIASESVGKAAIAMEGINDTDRQALSRAQDDLEQVLGKFAFENFGVFDKQGARVPGKTTLTTAQQESGVAAALLSGNIGGWLSAPRQTAIATEAMAVVTPEGGDFFDKRLPALEAYDEREAKTTQLYSIAYNMMAARQDEFGEAFFPTVVVTPDSAGYSVSVRVINVFNEVRHKLDGTVTDFKKRNVLEAAVKGEILRNDQTAIVPVKRPDTEAHFVTEAQVASYDVKVGTEDVTTAPLRVGARISLLGISENEALMETGMMDSTDAVDTGVRLKNIYIELVSGDGNTKETLKFPVANMQGATFNAAVQGNYRDMQLAMYFKTLMVTKNTKKADGNTSTLLDALQVAEATVRLEGSMTGRLNTETGETQVVAGELDVHQVSSSDGQPLGTDSGVGATLKALFLGAKVIGYELEANRTNSNRRQRGMLLGVDHFSQLYTVQLRSPLTVPRPMNVTDFNDTSDLAALITVTYMRTSIAAVDALFAARDVLKSFIANDQLTVASEVMGAGRYLVKPVYVEDDFNVSTSMDSIKSHERAADVQASLVNKIRDMVYSMYRDSRYKVAADAVAGGIAAAPTVIIGTDPVIARYLLVEGDFRTLSNEFNVKIVSTYNEKMTGKIAIAFGNFATADAGTPDPLHFGAMAWKPEVTTVLPTVRNGSNSKELSVMPAFLHVPTCPILGWLNVSGLSAAATTKSISYWDEK